MILKRIAERIGVRQGQIGPQARVELLAIATGTWLIASAASA